MSKKDRTNPPGFLPPAAWAAITFIGCGAVIGLACWRSWESGREFGAREERKRNEKEKSYLLDAKPEGLILIGNSLAGGERS